MRRLALLLGVSAIALASCKTITRDDAASSAIPVHTYGASSGNGSLGYHTVHKGETVWTISQRYGLVLRDVLDANRLAPPYNLSAGERLSLPAPQTYTARKGDTLYTVSQLFNTSTAELASLNKIPAPYKIDAGHVLKLPPQYIAPRSLAQPVVMRAAPPPFVEQVPRDSRIESEPLQPAAQTGKAYVPPPSSAEDYQYDAPARAEPLKEPPVVATPAAMSKPVGAPPAREGKFIKPVSGKVISGYGPKKDGLHNDGINIQAAKGDAVRAAETGVVVYTGNQIEGYGNLVLVRHADQYVTAYAHLDKTLVKKGDKVKRGQTIATVGATGAVDKPQLHFEVRKGTKALDPSGLVKL